MLTPVEKIITKLAKSEKILLNSKLAELSNLNPEDLELFKHSWATIDEERRREIVRRLVTLAENNLELNFDCILKFCLQDSDDEVKSNAIEGLWENEDASLIDILIDLLEQDTSDKVQVAATIALGKFAMLAECKKLRPGYISKIQEALLAAIANKTLPVEVNRRALEAAAPLSIPQVTDAIKDAYKSNNGRLKISSIYAMGKSCNPSWLPILLEELSSDDAEIRYEAAGACGELEEEAAVPYLARLINDADADVQMVAIQALGKIGGTQAKEYLEQCLDSSSEVVSQTAEQVLTELEEVEDSLFFRL